MNLKFSLILEELHVVEAAGEVVRHSARPLGMGVAFRAVGPEAQKVIGRAIRSGAGGRGVAARWGLGSASSILAKANLNALLDKANGDVGLDGLTDDELEAELRRWRERRQREQDERRAAERAAEAARTRTAEAAKARNEARAAEAAKAGAAQARRTTTTPPPRREESGACRHRPGGSIGDKRLRELYAQLEVPYGAAFEDVKKNFRRLMRKYHPDLHAGNPQKTRRRRS